MHPSVIADMTPDKPALVWSASGETVTYRELDERSNQGAQLFRKLGLNAGDVVAIFMENHPRYLEICWAAQRAGLYYTCISSRLTAAEVAYILRDCGARLFIAGHSLRAVAGELAREFAGLTLFMAGGTIPGYAAYEAAVEEMPSLRIADESTGMDMLYSSGTTGRPKGVRQPLSGHSIDTPHAQTLLFSTLYGFDAETRYLSPAPLYHSAPLRHCMAVQRLGGTVFAMERFDAEEVLRLIERHRITHAQFVPTMFVRLLRLPEAIRSRYDLSSLKAAIHAAAPCPIEVKRRMIAWWGPVLCEYYAGTEANGLCFVNSTDWLAHPGTVGRSLLNTLHICDDEGNELPAGAEGTIYFGSAQFQYHNDPEKTAQSRHPRNPGWSTLGDIGRLDEDGFLYLTDRKAFMIISGGVNIYPQETEDLLLGHPRIADVAVIGVPNEEFGEEVKAVVQPVDWNEAGPVLAKELLAYCRAHLSPLKCPKSIDFERELPRHPTGKLYKRLLRERYWQGHPSRIV